MELENKNMIELIQQRTYNSKHFLHPTETGKKILEAHAGHIHYKDGNDFKPLDWTLIFDEIKRGWGFNTHSYNPFIPEFSDGWAEFRDRFHDKDQTVKYKAIVQNIVKGELIETDETNPNFDNNIDNKGVLYRNAFGENRDYLLYNTRSSLVKVATVNNPNEQTKDAVFEWELEIPDKEIFRVDKKEDAEDMTRLATKTNTEDGKLVGYKLEKRDGKNLNTNKLTLIGNSKLDGKEWYTYLKSFKAWDSAGNTIEVVARIDFKDGKVILKKTIPLAFLQSAVGRVFTDTTTSFYSGAGDGRIYNLGYAGNVSWSTMLASAGTNAEPTGETSFCPLIQTATTTGKYLSQGIWLFQADTSAIGDSDTVTAANLKITSGTTNQNNLNLSGIGIIEATTASPTTLGVADFLNTTAHTTKLATSKTYAQWLTGNALNTFALNASGLAVVSKTGYTKLAVSFDNAIDNSEPSWVQNASTLLTIHNSENTNSSYDPYLSVTYSSGSTVTVTVSDTISTSEAIFNARTRVLALIDSVGLTETIGNIRNRIFSIADSINVSENTSLLKVITVMVNDTISLISTFGGAVRNRIMAVSDLIGLTEAVETVKTYIISVSDSISLSETINFLNVTLIYVVDKINIKERLRGIKGWLDKFSSRGTNWKDKFFK